MDIMSDSLEVAFHLCGIDENDDDCLEKAGEALYQKYGIEDPDMFDKLVKDLAKIAQVAKSELTEKWYRGFAVENLWLYKIEYK